MDSESGQRPEQVDWELLARHHVGETSDAEAAAVAQWASEHPAEARAASTVARASDRLRRPPPSGLDVAAALGRVSERIAHGADPRVLPLPTTRALRISPAWRVAAAVAIVVGGTLLWRMEGSVRSDLGTPVAAHTFVTQPGQRDSVVLADGTGILVGPGSSLRVETQYGVSRREVTLEGDALFDVRHDASKPFIVHAAGATVQDVGTAFAVHAASGSDAAVTVTVTSGIVRLAHPLASTTADSGVLLHAGEIGTARPGAPIEMNRAGSPDEELAWTRGQLVFRDTPLPAVAAALRQWYGVQVQIPDTTVNKLTVTASFQGEPLAQVLKVLGLALDARIQQRDSIVVIDRAPLGAKTSP